MKSGMISFVGRLALIMVITSILAFGGLLVLTNVSDISAEAHDPVPEKRYRNYSGTHNDYHVNTYPTD